MNDTMTLTSIPASAVARLVRKELKKAFPEISFRVSGTKSAWSAQEGSLSITWTDGVTVEKVEAIVGKYESIRNNYYGGWWQEPTITSNEDGTYYGVGSIDYDRELSDETKNSIVSRAMKITGTENEDDLQVIIWSGTHGELLSQEFGNADSDSSSFSPTIPDLWRFIYWAFHQKDS